MKTLVTSASRKLPLLRAIAAELGDDVVAGDADPHCIAAYAWPQFWLMPRLDAMSVDEVSDAIVDQGFDLVIPTRDADVALLATARSALADRGVQVMCSPAEAVTRCQDKLAFSTQLLAVGLPAIPTWAMTNLPDPLPERLVVKERSGAGAVGLTIDVDREAALSCASQLVDPVVQPYVEGQEFSIDAYRSREGVVLGLVARSRDVVIGGEAQVTTTVAATPYAELVTAVLETLGVEGHAVVQVINADTVNVVECNPRLGGASTLALAAGLRSLSWFAAESRGVDPSTVPFEPHPVPLQLVRVAQDVIGAPRL